MAHPTRPELCGDVGMVASTHWLASAAGMGILERGGNAADAAVAGGFVLQIVEPHLNGPGGEAPIIVWDEKRERTEVFGGQGSAPAAASVEAFRELGLDLVPGTGLLPAVVPGAFGAWMRLLQEHGTMSVREVLEPAIGYAEKGHPLLGRASGTLKTVSPLFTEHWPTSAEIWLRQARAPEAGERFRNPVLAATYRRLIQEAQSAGGDREQQIEAARRAWYCGFVAEAIGDYASSTAVMDVSGEPHRGLITAQDLADWRLPVEEPVTYDYKNYTVAKTGPWGQGPVMLQQLALLEGLGLDDVAPGSADWVHLIVETGKLAMADREAWYGDPDFTDVPMQALLSEEYTRSRQALVGDRASLELRPGRPTEAPLRMPAYADPLRRTAAGGGSGPGAGAGEPTVDASGETRGDTCHVDVVDASGMMVSATPSGGWMQASPAIPGLGFCLSTRGQMFWLQEDLPNTLRPGARPRTTLSPSFALRDGKPWLAFGTPGGDFQDQWQILLFLNLVHGGHDLQQAIDAPAFHSDHTPSSFYPREAFPGQLAVEGRFSAEVLADLERRGHRLVMGPEWSEGRLSAVAREGGWLRAGANPRGNQGYAVGR